MAMKVYSVLMFITAIAFGLVSVLFLCGETGWLRSFKMARYTDEKAYTKLIGKSLLYMAFVMIISGIVNIFTKTVFFNNNTRRRLYRYIHFALQKGSKVLLI